MKYFSPKNKKEKAKPKNREKRKAVNQKTISEIKIISLYYNLSRYRFHCGIYSRKELLTIF